MASRQKKKPVKLTHTERVVLEVSADIRAGRIAPGTRLDEAGIARRFDVSRTPVREALQHVVAAGLAVRRPHCGVFVPHPPGEGEKRELQEALDGILQVAEQNGGRNRFLAEAADAMKRRLEGAG